MTNHERAALARACLVQSQILIRQIFLDLDPDPDPDLDPDLDLDLDPDST